MENPSSDSEDEAPEEFSFKVSNEEAAKQEQERKNALLTVKKEMKRIRSLNHEKNRLQQEEKRKRLEELEDKKLPLELLNSITDTDKNTPEKKVKKKKKKKNLRKIKLKEDYVSSVNDSVIVQVLPLEGQNKLTKSLKSIAEDFKNKKIVLNKNIKRIPSRDLRMIKEKRKYGGKIGKPASVLSKI